VIAAVEVITVVVTVVGGWSGAGETGGASWFGGATTTWKALKDDWEGDEDSSGSSGISLVPVARIHKKTAPRAAPD
jgi:hypothetical protein